MRNAPVAHVEPDLTACKGYGNCAIEAPEFFDVDDDGVVVVLRQPASSDDLQHAEAAARACPVAALKVVQP